MKVILLGAFSLLFSMSCYADVTTESDSDSTEYSSCTELLHTERPRYTSKNFLLALVCASDDKVPEKVVFSMSFQLMELLSNGDEAAMEDFTSSVSSYVVFGGHSIYLRTAILLLQNYLFLHSEVDLDPRFLFLLAVAHAKYDCMEQFTQIENLLVSAMERGHYQSAALLAHMSMNNPESVTSSKNQYLDRFRSLAPDGVSYSDSIAFFKKHGVFPLMCENPKLSQ